MTIQDTGERIIPIQSGEVSCIFARHQFAYEYATNFVNNSIVLDMGCGTGYGCKILAEGARFVYGIDHDWEAIRFSNEHFAAPNIKYFQMDAACLAFSAASFDVTIGFQIIEHMPNLHKFLCEIRRVLKPDGCLLISTPNVPKKQKPGHRNPFHRNELDLGDFRKLLEMHFSDFQIFGVMYESQNRWRNIIQKLPIYQLGRCLKRKSIIKRLASRALDLAEFRITEESLESAMDLMAVCGNHRSRSRVT